MKADVDSVFLHVDDFAEIILRYAGGLGGPATQVAALVTWDATQDVQDRGRANRRTGELFIADSASVTVKDLFRIDADTVQITAVGPIQDGAQTAYFVQYIPETKGATSLKTGDL